MGRRVGRARSESCVVGIVLRMMVLNTRGYARSECEECVYLEGNITRRGKSHVETDTRGHGNRGTSDKRL